MSCAFLRPLPNQALKSTTQFPAIASGSAAGARWAARSPPLTAAPPFSIFHLRAQEILHFPSRFPRVATRLRAAPSHHALTHLHKFNFDMSSNISALRAGANSAFIPYPQLNSTLLNAGIFINDVAIDADNGDAYFTDSSNCREDAATARFPPSPPTCLACEYPCRNHEGCDAIGGAGRCSCLCLVPRAAPKPSAS